MDLYKTIKELEEKNHLLTEINKSYHNKLMCMGYKMALDDLKAYFDSDFQPLGQQFHFDSEGRFLDE